MNNNLSLLIRNIWILVLSVLVLSSAGIIYHEKIVAEPEEYHEVSASVFLYSLPETNGISNVIQFPQLHLQVVGALNDQMSINISPEDLRSGIHIESQGNTTATLYIRASQQDYIDRGISRSRIPAGNNNEYVNQIIQIFVNELLIFSQQSHILSVNVEKSAANSGFVFVDYEDIGHIMVIKPNSVPLFIFILIGVILGMFIIIIRMLISDRVYNFESIEKKYNTKIIGMLPNYRK